MNLHTAARVAKTSTGSSIGLGNDSSTTSRSGALTTEYPTHPIAAPTWSIPEIRSKNTARLGQSSASQNATYGADAKRRPRFRAAPGPTVEVVDRLDTRPKGESTCLKRSAPSSEDPSSTTMNSTRVGSCPQPSIWLTKVLAKHAAFRRGITTESCGGKSLILALSPGCSTGSASECRRPKTGT